MNRILFLLMMCPLGALAQNILGIEDAVEAGLAKNFGGRIAIKQQEIAHGNVTLGNAGFLPRGFIDLGYNGTVQNVEQRFISGQEQNRRGARSSLLSSGAELRWTVFDGLRMFRTLDLLKQLDSTAGLQADAEAIGIYRDVSLAWLDAVRQGQQMELLRQGLEISRLRLDLAEARYQAGAQSRGEYLQAKVDFNGDSAGLVNQAIAMLSAKALLAQLMADGDTSFRLPDTLAPPERMALPLEAKEWVKNNPMALAAASQVVSENERIAIQKSFLYPEVDIYSRYNFTDQQSQAGFLLSNQSRGINNGVSLYWTVFDGLNSRRLVENAKITREISRLQEQDVLQELGRQFADAAAAYNQAWVLYALEESTVEFAAQNLDIANERYRAGRTTLLEYRTAQLSYIQAKTRLFDAVYRLRAGDVRLRALRGLSVGG